MEVNNIMKFNNYKIVLNSNKIKMSEYIRNFYDRDKFHKLCMQCEKYGKLWSCPPYSFEVKDILNKYDNVYLIGAKIILSDKLICETKKEDILECTYTILNEVRKILGDMLLNLEDRYQESLSLYAGSCLLCENCDRLNNKPCRFPERMRYSLESLGFDVSKTSSELLDIDIKWANDKLPEYFTLVSAFFTNREIDNILER